MKRRATVILIEVVELLNYLYLSCVYNVETFLEPQLPAKLAKISIEAPWSNCVENFNVSTFSRFETIPLPFQQKEPAN